MTYGIAGSGGCPRCEQFPEPLPSALDLYLWFPIGHTLGKAVQVIRAHAWPARVDNRHQCLIVTFEAENLPTLGAHFEEHLSGRELADTRALIVEAGRTPGFADFGRIITLEQAIASCDARWLIGILENGMLRAHFQPIAEVDDLGRWHGREGLLRAVDQSGESVSPGRLFDTARRGDLLFQLDRAARTTIIDTVARHPFDERVFINFTPTAIYDPEFCLRTTVEAVDTAGIEHGRVVFEVVESDRTLDPEHLGTILSYYREADFLVALDDVGAGYSSLNLIHQLRPDYIKLDMDLTRDVDRDPYRAAITRNLLQIARELDIRTIAEGIESEAELDWLREHSVNYVQGFLIARPQPLA